MQKQTIIINGENFSDLKTFFEEIDRVLTHELDWNTGHNSDAFNDLLYGGFGVHDPEEPIILIWKNSAKSKVDFGMEATKKHYENIISCEPPNIEYFRGLINDLMNKKGQTLFETFMAIISKHEHIEFKTEN